MPVHITFHRYLHRLPLVKTGNGLGYSASHEETLSFFGYLRLNSLQYLAPTISENEIHIRLVTGDAVPRCSGLCKEE
ncbi:MAG: hypothetical protein DDT29_01985 [Dehalococcoidia bacterium]|nr:hypothetical protein [Bacillota bacterium]